jgi:hypothetical protein
MGLLLQLSERRLNEHDKKLRKLRNDKQWDLKRFRKNKKRWNRLLKRL